MFLNDVKIVLSRVSEAGNAGAVCRAMKNMGLSQLRLASPQSLVLEKIFTRAVNARDIWENARIFDSLAEAAADCSIVVGTTRRRGHNRKSISMPPRVLAEYLASHPGPAAIVFGNERTGLEEKELDMCNFASHIPVSDECPSLNLSHAVQLYAYEFFLAMEQQPNFKSGECPLLEQHKQGLHSVKGEWTAMNQTEISVLVDQITDDLASIGFYKKPNREYQSRFLRDLIARAGLAQGEGQYFANIFKKACMLGDMD
ncbi:MAG: RNA methyltransferase [Treponema sp.]|nr:RNA methyltransferase [Treponema sp.]MCL2252668.1 RNA methyltransferase [Treponema sp.]